ncbi:MAG: hypothetical protein JWM68_5682 [Verrucomicrobiales bacterium]|nr:hypothetical protein [Verrucomicrobiales bacterium]
MKPVNRYKSQLLYSKSYKPVRTFRIRQGVKSGLTFRPTRLSVDRKIA